MASLVLKANFPVPFSRGLRQHSVGTFPAPNRSLCTTYFSIPFHLYTGHFGTLSRKEHRPPATLSHPGAGPAGAPDGARDADHVSLGSERTERTGRTNGKTRTWKIGQSGWLTGCGGLETLGGECVCVSVPVIIPTGMLCTDVFHSSSSSMFMIGPWVG